MNDTLGKIHFWGTMIGSYVIFWPMHYMGLAGVPRRYYTWDTFDAFNQFDDLNKFITVGAIVTFGFQLVFVINFFYSIFRGRKQTVQNPWGATTLEWTAPVEHIHGNWPGEIPAVHRWAYDYGKDGREFIVQTEPMAPGESDSSH